jgi:hypothetical protein
MVRVGTAEAAASRDEAEKGAKTAKKGESNIIKKTEHATKSISESSNENVLLLCADFRSLFRQFCATISLFFFSAVQ